MSKKKSLRRSNSNKEEETNKVKEDRGETRAEE